MCRGYTVSFHTNNKPHNATAAVAVKPQLSACNLDRLNNNNSDAAKDTTDAHMMFVPAVVVKDDDGDNKQEVEEQDPFVLPSSSEGSRYCPEQGQLVATPPAQSLNLDSDTSDKVPSKIPTICARKNSRVYATEEHHHHQYHHDYTGPAAGALAFLPVAPKAANLRTDIDMAHQRRCVVAHRAAVRANNNLKDKALSLYGALSPPENEQTLSYTRHSLRQLVAEAQIHQNSVITKKAEVAIAFAAASAAASAAAAAHPSPPGGEEGHEFTPRHHNFHQRHFAGHHHAALSRYHHRSPIHQRNLHSSPNHHHGPSAATAMAAQAQQLRNLNQTRRQLPKPLNLISKDNTVNLLRDVDTLMRVAQTKGPSTRERIIIQTFEQLSKLRLWSTQEDPLEDEVSEDDKYTAYPN